MAAGMGQRMHPGAVRGQRAPQPEGMRHAGFESGTSRNGQAARPPVLICTGGGGTAGSGLELSKGCAPRTHPGTARGTGVITQPRPKCRPCFFSPLLPVLYLFEGLKLSQS